jgi:DNA-binding protein H-NS
MSAKQVAAWFTGLDFKQQETCLRGLAHLHDKEKAKHIAALRKQLAALGDVDVAAPAAGRRRTVAAKYRDAKSGQTWSGRGRMAAWLAAKVKAGEKAAKYLVR